MSLRLCRFRAGSSGSPDVRIGLVDDERQVRDLTPAGVTRLQPLLESDDPAAAVNRLRLDDLPRAPLSGVELCSPVERQEIWAAGVTYLRSKVARMEESDFSATAYDKVYDADRPEIFFKCLAEKTVPPDQPVGIRRDATWNVPEPELAVVLNSRGRIAGYTIGNDMSSRDIEGANLLYLPQAKIYNRSCALGPWIVVGVSEDEARRWTIGVRIRREGAAAFAGETSVGHIKRPLDQLAEYLFRCQVFPHGAVLLTGTGVIPPDTFTLQAEDVVEIHVSGIGVLNNPVVVV
jgi:2-dehydro-3-deoxy-D-arabinonate dehydratase